MISQSKEISSKGIKIGIIVAAVVTLCGVGLWVYQLIAGMSLTNMGDSNAWGLYIIGFMFMVGLATGIMIVSCMPRVFGSSEFDGLSKMATWLSICCTVLAIGCVVIDLGSPLRVWELFAYSNFSSPLMWDIIALPVFLIVSIIYLVALIRFEKGKTSAKGVRALATVSLVVAIGVCSVDAWIFGLQQSQDFWYTAMLAPWFIASALASGTALLLVVLYVLRKAVVANLSEVSAVKLVKLLGIFVIVDLYFLGCDLLTNVFPGSSAAESMSVLFSGSLAPFFWSEVVMGLVAATLCFIPSLRNKPAIVVACVLALVGVFCKRFQFLIGGFSMPNIDWPGVITGKVNTVAMIVPSYLPSLPECGIMFGVLGLGVLLLLLGLRYLPLAPSSSAH